MLQEKVLEASANNTERSTLRQRIIAVLTEIDETATIKTKHLLCKSYNSFDFWEGKDMTRVHVAEY